MRLFTVLLSAILAVSACAPKEPAASKSVLYVYRFEPPAFLELDDAWHAVRELPFSIPQGCDLGSVHGAPRGHSLAIELLCAFGPVVLWMDTGPGTIQQPIAGSDSHYLAWAPDGQSIYMKVDTINRPRIVRVSPNGGQDPLPIDGLTYDLAPAPSGDAFLFTFSRGMGLGSEMWLADRDGAALRRIAIDASSYMSLARWSPDGKYVAFMKIPDSATPFALGELWVMQGDGGDATQLASADAGHGFAPEWSPDGRRIAFVARENPGDPSADVSSDELISNIQLIDLDSALPRPVTDFKGARVEAPSWMPGADLLFFNARADDRMAVYVLDLIGGDVKSIPIRSICCAAWLRE